MSTKKNKLKNMAQMKSKKKKLKYDVLTDIEHVLQRPDTYGGSVTEETWKINFNGKTEEQTIVPMLFKIFDEAIVNAADNYTRNVGMNYLYVDIDKEDGMFSVENNGKTVPIKKHPKKDALTGEKIYTPEMVFFRMRSGQNFDDTEVRYEGGRNGIGIKLASIFSTISEVEIRSRTKQFVQSYKDNMKTRGNVTCRNITHPYPKTKVFFKIDLSRFKINDQPLTKIPDDVFELMVRRVYDVAACCPHLQVKLNTGHMYNLVQVPKFYSRYLNEEPLFVSEKKNWSVAVQLTDRENDSKDSISLIGFGC